MSASAPGLSDRAPARFWSTTVGVKAVMAVSGVVLFGYVIAHLLGNLQVFLPNGPTRLDEYSGLLHRHPKLLWIARSILLVMLGLHVWSYIVLGLRKLSARPLGYVKKRSAGSTIAARTMYWSGPFVFAYVIYHILDLTTGTVHPGFEEGSVYHNLIGSFQNPAVAMAYIVAIILLCMHLHHGLWSWVQSLGFYHPRYTPVIRRVAAALAIVIAAGYISIPLAVLFRYLR